jgi:hypothetical protein
MEVFPSRDVKECHAFLIDFSIPQQLPSPDHDVVTWSKLLLKKCNFLDGHITIIVGTEISRQKITAQLPNKDISIVMTADKASFLALLGKWSLEHKDQDLLWLLSGHGFRCGPEDFTVHPNRQEPIYSHELHSALLDSLEEKANCLCIIDTCASGSQLNVMPGNPAKPNITVLSACDDAEFDADDISDFGLFGGGLTAAMCDEGIWIDQQLQITNSIPGIQARLLKAGQTFLVHRNQQSR